MDAAEIKDAAEVREARQHVERALSGLATLHLGPLDYNAASTVDCLQTAAAILEEFGKLNA